MKALQLIMMLIQAGARSMALARTLAEAKKNAEEQGRDLTEAELRSFQKQAHDAIALAEQTISQMPD